MTNTRSSKQKAMSRPTILRRSGLLSSGIWLCKEVRVLDHKSDAASPIPTGSLISHYNKILRDDVLVIIIKR